MDYVLCYKGKALGEPMQLDLAEAMLVQMGSCFKHLEIVQASALVEKNQLAKRTG